MADKKDPKVVTKPRGDAGLNEFATNTNRTVEHLPELQGREGSVKYRQMSKGDGQVGMLLRVHKNPIRSCAWGIQVPDDPTEDELLAIEILKRNLLGECGMQFSKLLGQILSNLEYGYSLFERYWKPYEYEGNMYLTPVLEQRLQVSIEDIWPKERIVRQMTIENGMVEIPFDDLVFFTLNQQGDDLRGESILRNAYKAWKEKNAYSEWMGIGVQRGGTGGIPSMVVPKGTRVDSEDYIAAEQLLKNITFHEEAYMILPEGWTFSMIENKFDPAKLQACIDAKNSEMALSVLAQFVLLGQQGNTGAYALSRDQSDFFLDGLQYVVELIEGILNEQVIQPFLRYNFGETVDPERLKIKGLNLNKKAGTELANVLNTLKTAGFIKANVDDEILLRKFLDMPELSKEEVDARRQAVQDNNYEDPTPDQGNPEDPSQDPNKDQPVKLSETKASSRKARQEHIDKSIREVQDVMVSGLLNIKDKLMADVETVLNRGSVEISGLKTIQVSTARYQKTLERKFAGIAIESWNLAKAGTKAAIKLAEDKDPKQIVDKVLRQFVLNNATVISDNQAQAILSRAILTASNGPLKGYTIAQTLANVSAALDEYIDGNSVSVAGSLVSVGTSNFGASQFYNEIKDQLWGYEFVNADPVSEICQWYAGKTFSVDSPELAMATAPLHPNCKSYMEPIYRSEAKPKIDDVIAPPSIQKQKSIF